MKQAREHAFFMALCLLCTIDLQRAWMFVPVRMCGEGASLDVFVFASEWEKVGVIGGGVEPVAGTECVYF